MEQQGPALAVADHDSVRQWTMQLAPVNAINAEMLDAFEAALDDAEADRTVAAVVLDSGLKVFSAGADATWMAQTVESIGPQGLLEDFNATMDRFRAVCLRLRQAPFLVIAALDGHALAGGWSWPRPATCGSALTATGCGSGYPRWTCSVACRRAAAGRSS